MYIDESGDSSPYLDKAEKVIDGSSKWFSLGGIIVNEDTKLDFNSKIEKLIKQFFNNVKLSDNFKLHYHPLRQKRFPYDQISDEERWSIPDTIFNWIETSNCTLLSVTIDLEKHCERYGRPIDPVAYTLLVMLERFQYFLEDEHDKGIAIYEKFNSKMRKKVKMELKWLNKLTTFKFFSGLENIVEDVRNGNPKNDPILQMADFFAYVPWLWFTTEGNARDRLNQIIDKMYNLNGSWNRSGFVKL